MMIAGIAHSFGVVFSLRVGAIVNDARRLLFLVIRIRENSCLLLRIAIGLDLCLLVIASSIIIFDIDCVLDH